MAYTQEQIDEVAKAVNKKVEDLTTWSIEEIEEPIFVEQIEEGEIEQENFYEAITGMGLPYIKKGRVPFKEVEQIAPEILELFKKSINPRTDVKDVLKMKTKKGVDDINNRIRKTNKIKQRDKDKKIESNIKVHEELKLLESKKVKLNTSLMWSIYTIMRGRKRLERFEEDGKDVELLRLQNSFLTDEIIDELKELRTEYYEE